MSQYQCIWQLLILETWLLNNWATFYKCKNQMIPHHLGAQLHDILQDIPLIEYTLWSRPERKQLAIKGCGDRGW